MIDGNPFPNAPKPTFKAFAEYIIDVANGAEVFMNADWAVQGDTNLFLYEAPEFEASSNTEGGAAVGYRSKTGKYTTTFFVRNITDEENLKGAIDFNNLTGFVNEPRIFGLSFGASI